MPCALRTQALGWNPRSNGWALCPLGFNTLHTLPRARTRTRTRTHTHARTHTHTHAHAHAHELAHAHAHAHAHARAHAPAPATAHAPGTTHLDNLRRQHESSQTGSKAPGPGKHVSSVAILAQGFGSSGEPGLDFVGFGLQVLLLA